MFAGLFKLLLFFILFIVIITLVGAFKLMRFVRKTTESFNQQSQQHSGRRTQYGANGEEVIDTKARDKADKKIFAKDEGEYVDYQEV